MYTVFRFPVRGAALFIVIASLFTGCAARSSSNFSHPLRNWHDDEKIRITEDCLVVVAHGLEMRIAHAAIFHSVNMFRTAVGRGVPCVRILSPHRPNSLSTQ